MIERQRKVTERESERERETERKKQWKKENIKVDKKYAGI